MQTNQKFNLICETVDNGIILLDRDLTVLFWNSWLEARTNIDATSIKKKKLVDFFPNINAKQLNRKINTALNLNSPTFYNSDINKFLLDIELKNITDKVFNFMRQGVTITPYDIDKGWVIVYIYDTTLLSEINYKLRKKNGELKESQQKIQDEINKIELLLDATMEAMFVFEENSCINTNENALDLFEYQNREMILGKEIVEFFKNSSDLQLALQYNKPFETELKKQDGSFFPALLKVKQTQIQNKETKILTVVDLSELKSKEQLLAEQTKMAAMGEMIGNIAHQWRQPLSTISTAASGIKVIKEYDILTDEALEESLNGIIKGVNYLSQTIEDFREFLRGDKEKIFFNLSSNIKKDLSIIKGMITASNIEVVETYDRTIELFSFSNELSQAIINILTNAKDAFETNSIKERYIFINSYVKNNNAIIEIKDNAGGIDPYISNKIFEPYFTTKHKSQGTGLGLYMSRMIIQNSMGGKLEVKNSDNGVCFYIKVPVCTDKETCNG